MPSPVLSLIGDASVMRVVPFAGVRSGSEITVPNHIFDGSGMTALGHVCAFSVPLSCVWNATVNRHSGRNVGYAELTGPRM